MSNLRTLFYQHCAQTSPTPLELEIIKAEGIYLTDSANNKYMDLISGISVSNVGHCHPKVIEAVKNQTEKFMHLMVYGEYIYSPQVKLATKLASILPSHLNTSYFVNSGSEAIEGAIKVARKFTGRSELISCVNAYHGSTLGALSIMGNVNYKKHFAPLIPDTKLIRHGEIEDLSFISNKTAAIVVEAIQAEAGIRFAQSEYWQKLQEKCKETGTLIICDEIQTGFGRTGKMFGFEFAGFTPDIITIAKGFGGGMPIGAFISSNEIMASLTTNPILGHISTFGGHPVTTAAALATIGVIEEENIISNIPEKAELFKVHLKNAPKVLEFRQAGLMMALEFDSFEMNKKIIDICLSKGIITDWFLFDSKSMRIAPPLTISKDEINKACNIIFDVLKNL